MQIGVVAKKIGLSVDAIRFYERNGPASAAAQDGGRLPSVRRKRRRDAGLCPSRAGAGIPAQGDSGTLETARESLAALCAGAASGAGKVGRRATETYRPSQAGARIAFGPAQLQQRDAQASRSLSDSDREKPTETGGREVKIEVLYVAECPSHPAAERMVKDVLAAEGVVTEVQEVLVRDEGMASELKFLGSPTIRVNGRDVAAETRKVQSFALSCRLYPGSKQVGLPPTEMIHRAVIEARQGERG